MRKCLFAALLVAIASPTAQPQTRWTPELSMKVDTIGEVLPSPDGKWAAYTRTRAVMEKERSEMMTQIQLASTDGSRSFQLTAGEKSATAPAFSPNSKYVYFRSSRSGKSNLWRISAHGGEARRVTDWDGEIGAYRISPDGQWIAFLGRKSDPDAERAEKEKTDVLIVDDKPKHHALWLIRADVPAGEGPEPRKVFDRPYHLARLEWSPDSRHIVFEHWPRPEADYWLQANISEVEVASGKLTVIAGTTQTERSPHYSPDGKLLAYVRSSKEKNWSREGRLIVRDLDGGHTRTLPVTHDEFGRGSLLLGFSGDSKRLFFTETRGTRTQLMEIDIEGGSPKKLNQPARGTLAGSGGGTRLNTTVSAIGFVRESMNEPAEAAVLDLASGRVAAAGSVKDNLPMPPLGRTELIRWKSKDGLEIEGLLTYPVEYRAGTKVPLVLVIHGGPMGVFTETFIGGRGLYPIAAFAARGYAVLRPNPRGSSGYGKKFRMANYGEWGEGDYEDILSGVDHVVSMGVADPSRMAVMGWSYGGFMTSWVVGQTDRFQVACVGAAVTNLWSFTGTADISDFLPDYFRGEPWENFEAYRRHSPMSYVGNVKTPSLILHGAEDVRVPTSQGYEFYNALKRRGVRTKMVVYPRTPHGPREPKFLLDVARRHMSWIEPYLD